MPAKHVAPSINLKSFNCPRCGALADQTWYKVCVDRIGKDQKLPTVFQLEKVEELAADNSFAREMGKTERTKLFDDWRKIATGEIFFEQLSQSDAYSVFIQNLHVSNCYSCNQISLWKHESLIYPRETYQVEPNEDLTDDIRRDFKEACSVLEVSPRSAAALLRLCLQKMCIQLGLAGKNINEDIASLVEKGLRPEIQKALDILRVIGNEAVHPGTIDLRDNKEIALKLFEIVNRVAYDMITHPKEIALLYSTLPPSKLKAIEERDGKK